MSGHTETDYESEIEDRLVGSGGYARRTPADYDAALALFPDDVVGFIQDTQPARWDALHALLGDRTRATVLESLGKELEVKGTLHVLRHGFKCYGKKLRLAAFRPNSGMNPEAAAAYAQNRLTVTRQVAFPSAAKLPSGKRRRCVIDVTLALNGLPVVTAELKNPQTGQRAADAIEQYETRRDERDLLFQFKKRALVHFAVDPDEVWMTTRLKGTDTVFLPFNKGHNFGAGNPPAEGDWKTHYLWDDVLQADSLLDVLQRFMHLEVTEKQVRTEKGARTIRREAMIFPRYHQLDAVRKLVAHAQEHGLGTQLPRPALGRVRQVELDRVAGPPALQSPRRRRREGLPLGRRRHRPARARPAAAEHDLPVRAQDGRRREDQRGHPAARQGAVVGHAGRHHDDPEIPVHRAGALDAGEEGGGRRHRHGRASGFAVIVDEAHSSQSGETATSLRGMLNRDGIEAAVAAQLSEEEDDDLSAEAREVMLRDAQTRARQPNLSFFAFTATPKFKTRVLFDEPGPIGRVPVPRVLDAAGHRGGVHPGRAPELHHLQALLRAGQAGRGRPRGPAQEGG